MTAHLLTRRSHSRKYSGNHRAGLAFLGELSLPFARTHEICGNARYTLAMIIAACMDGPVYWITPGWSAAQMNPEGMLTFADPSRFIFVAPHKAEDLLWGMEEVLRSGAVPLVIADMSTPPGLTPVRRLNLAAEVGAADGRQKPIGLLLTPGDGGAQGVETRWHMASTYGDESPAWTLTRSRARTEPPKTWPVGMKEGRFALMNTSPERAPNDSDRSLSEPHKRSDPPRASRR